MRARLPIGRPSATAVTTISRPGNDGPTGKTTWGEKMPWLNDVLSGRPMKIFVVAKKKLRGPDHAKHEKPEGGGDQKCDAFQSRNVRIAQALRPQGKKAWMLR